MSFWNTSSGEDARETAEKELPDNSFEPLPDKTKVLVNIDQAGIDKDKNFNERAFAEMTVIKPDAYAGRKLFPKFWIFDDNPNVADAQKKRDNDLRRFSRLDAACGGKLARAGKTPTDETIALALTGKNVIVHVMLMTPKDGDPLNWYSDYWAKGEKDVPEVEKPARKPAAKKQEPAADDLDDSDIPF